MPLDLAKKIGFCLTCDHVRFDEAQSQRFCTQTGNKISRQCELGCPLRLHDVPPFPQVPPECKTFFPKEVQAYRAAWRMLHTFPATLAEDFDPDEVRRWLKLFPSHHLPAGCPCRLWYAMTLALMPPDLSNRMALFRWTVAIHNAKNLELGKPEISCARAARIHGVTHLLPTEEIAADDSGPIRLWIHDGWGLGDAVMMTGVLRDLLAAYPGEFEVRVSGIGRNYAVFENLPHITSGLTPPKDYVPDIACHWHLLDHKQTEHVIDWMRERLAAVLNRHIPAGERRPWLRLSETQKAWAPPVSTPYVVLAAGYKLNLTIKSYPHWQQVIDALAGKVTLVRVGAKDKCSPQPELRNVPIDLTQKTTQSQLIAMIAHPLCVGTLSGDTSLPHIAAAFGKPAVVVAGDRLPPVAAQYEGHNWLRHNLPCSGCNLSRVVALDPKLPWPELNHHLCKHPEGTDAKCMKMIAPSEVVVAVLSMINAPPPRWPAVPSP